MVRDLNNVLFLQLGSVDIFFLFLHKNICCVLIRSTSVFAGTCLGKMCIWIPFLTTAKVQSAHSSVLPYKLHYPWSCSQIKGIMIWCFSLFQQYSSQLRWRGDNERLYAIKCHTVLLNSASWEILTVTLWSKIRDSIHSTVWTPQTTRAMTRDMNEKTDKGCHYLQIWEDSFFPFCLLWPHLNPSYLRHFYLLTIAQSSPSPPLNDHRMFP